MSDLLRDAIALLRDIAPELQAEADQREYGGNGEDFAAMRALSDRARALLDRADTADRSNVATLASAHLRDERQGSVLPMKPGEWRCVCGHINPPEYKRCHGCEQDRADG